MSDRRQEIKRCSIMLAVIGLFLTVICVSMSSARWPKVIATSSASAPNGPEDISNSWKPVTDFVRMQFGVWAQKRYDTGPSQSYRPGRQLNVSLDRGVCTANPSLKQMHRGYTEGQHINVCVPKNLPNHLPQGPLPWTWKYDFFLCDSRERQAACQYMMSFNNCCMTVSDVATPDPFVTFAHGRYHMTFTAGDRVEIWSSPNLLEIGRGCDKHMIWKPPPDTHYSGGIWAPELHAIEGRWYVYVAAEDPKHGNKSHRMYVLGGPPASQPPAPGPWEFLGPIAGMPDHWAIDGTILPLNGKNYFVYSGWPFHNPSQSDLTQELFIIELASPTKAAGKAVAISHPHEPWERSADHGINEGPQVLKHPDGHSWVGIVYSCAGSWTKDYKMNTLRYNGGDPLHPQSWSKSRYPLIQGRQRGGAPFGPGHGSFLSVSGDTVGIFHATDGEADGWENRKARIQRVMWTQEGPWMGEVGPLVDNVQHYLAPGPHMGGGGYPGGVHGAGYPGGPSGGRPQDQFDLDALKAKAKSWLKKF